nr:phosphate ABC transporter substrate-binding protein [uncultured Acetatifactor sp.]
MGKERRGRLRGAVLCALLIGSLAGCAGPQAERQRDGGAAYPPGSLDLAGSSSMEKLTDALAEGFMEQYPDVAVTVQFTGSSAGIEAVVNGSADIGNISRNLSEEETDRGARAYVVALDGIAVCVDSANPVTEITERQLRDIFTGKIRNWAELGGGDVPIVPIGREAGSGTRETFEGLLGISGRCTYGNEMDSTGAVMARITSTPGAIGYVSFDAVSIAAEKDKRNNVHALSLDGVEPTIENVKEGNYLLSRPFLMVTHGELSAQSGLVRLWFCYVYSEEGRSIAEKAGLAVPDGSFELKPAGIGYDDSK